MAGSATNLENPKNSPEHIRYLAESLQNQIQDTLKRMQAANSQTTLLSINAAIEAARVGDTGKGFSVVANEMKELSKLTGNIADEMASKITRVSNELQVVSTFMATHVRGERLANLALQNISLIDRNLYERSCDVRWWATDSCLVLACQESTKANRKYASVRMGVILSAYTVYYDLILCNLDGQIIANGRPESYGVQGFIVKNEPWFVNATKSESGNEFSFQSVTPSPLLNHQRCLIYSCGVRENGSSEGALIGVLGILFNWDALAQVIVHATPLPKEEKPYTRAVIIDQQGCCLADSAHEPLKATISLNEIEFNASLGYMETKGGDLGRSLIGFAQAPGYENYSTKWHSLIIQDFNHPR